MLDELIEVHDHYRDPANRGQFVRSGLRMYADLPFRKDPSKAVPDSVYEVTRSQPLRTGVRDLYWQGGDLMVDGHAFIHRVPEATRASSVRRFQLRRLDGPSRDAGLSPPSGSSAPTSPPGPPAPPSPTTRPASSPGCRRRCCVWLRGAQGSFEVLAQVATPSARRGSSVGNPELGRGRHPRRALIAPDELAIPAYAGKRLTISVRRVEALLESVRNEGDAVRFTLRAAGGSLQNTALFLRRTDALRAQIVPLTVTGDRAHATVSADDLEVRSSSLGDREWLPRPADPGRGADGRPRSLLDMAPEMEDTLPRCTSAASPSARTSRAGVPRSATAGPDPCSGVRSGGAMACTCGASPTAPTSRP